MNPRQSPRLNWLGRREIWVDKFLVDMLVPQAVDTWCCYSFITAGWDFTSLIHISSRSFLKCGSRNRADYDTSRLLPLGTPIVLVLDQALEKLGEF